MSKKNSFNYKQNICSNCNSSILRMRRNENGELKLFCNLCKDYSNLPNWYVNKLEKTFFKKKIEQKTMKNKKEKLYIQSTQSKKACEKCGNLLQTRKYKKLPVKLSRKHYYFSEWEYCAKCYSTFFEEKNKITLTEKDKENIKTEFQESLLQEQKTQYLL